MSIRISASAAILASVFITACGGGGGGDGSGSVTPPAPTAPVVAPANPDGSWLTLTPAAPEVATFEGESIAFTVRASSSRMFQANFNVGIFDKSGVIEPTVKFDPVTPLIYDATLSTSRSLAAGTHSSTLEVRICEDDPTLCRKPFPGSPWRLPVTVKVAPKAEGAARLTVAPASVAVTTFEGESAQFSLTAVAPALGLNWTQVAFFSNRPDLIARAPANAMFVAGAPQYTANMTTAPTLPVGEHSGILEVRACEDDPQVCARPRSGSPWLVPITVTVKPNRLITPLRELPGVAGWSTYQGNAAHTGYIPASFDAAAFSRRWDYRVATTPMRGMSLAVDNGFVFLHARAEDGAWTLHAVSEDSGNVAWTHPVGRVGPLTPPSAANGKVYLTGSDALERTTWVIDQRTGQLLAKATAPPADMSLLAVSTPFDNALYSASGFYGALSKFDGTSGAFAWDAGVGTRDPWTPAVDGRFVYGYLGELRAYDIVTGKQAFAIADPAAPMAYTESIILGDNGMAFRGASKGYDLSRRTLAWARNAPTESTYGDTAYAKGRLYTFDGAGGRIVAIGADSGKTLWQSEPLDRHGYQYIVVTDNVAFISTEGATSAVDLQTGQIVWRYPFGGKLAISNRAVLYVYGVDGRIGAVNLR